MTPSHPKPFVNLFPVRQVRARRLFFYLGQIGYKGRNIFFVLLSVIVLGGLLFTLFDGKSLVEGQYLAIITALTVGYGDLAPETWPARVVSGVVGINGILLTGVIIACVVKALELTFHEELDVIARESTEGETASEN